MSDENDAAWKVTRCLVCNYDARVFSLECNGEISLQTVGVKIGR